MNVSHEASIYRYLKNTYKINHLLAPNTSIVFILESPHIDELLHQTPLSGLSGKAISKVLFGSEVTTPFGPYLKGHYDTPTYQQFGIMNICSIPMQKSAYTQPKVEEMYGPLKETDEQFFYALEKIRTSPKHIYRDERRNILQQWILEDFKHSLLPLSDRKLVIIPCGKTAQTFFALANIENANWQVITDVPHPSYGNWFKEKYAEKILEITSLTS